MLLKKSTTSVALAAALMGYTAYGVAATTPTVSCSNAATWSSSGVYSGSTELVQYNGVEYRVNWWTQGNNPTTSSGGPGSGEPWTAVGTCATSASPSPTPAPAPTPTPGAPAPTPAPTPTPTPSPSPVSGTVTTSGDVFYHLATVPASSSAGLTAGDGDDLNLAGAAYTDLIMSNIIAGSMQVYLINKTYPGVQFNNDYMHGMILGQLLQENEDTAAYQNTGNLIAPLSLVGANQTLGVMGSGQGGPYQINSYAWDQIGGNSDLGFALANFVPLQKNIGFSLSQAAAQAALPTPPSFNNKYYGPMLVAYWHYNDLRVLIELAAGNGSNPAPTINTCLANLKNTPNAPLDVPLGYAYNAGYNNGGLVTNAFNLCSSNAAAFVSKYDNYANSAGDSYNDYPYQVRFYLDELYGNAPGIDPNNHIAFNITNLGSVFSNVFQTLAYVNSNESYVYITAAQATTAYSLALQQTGVSSTVTLDLSNTTQRATIFQVLAKAINNLETTLNTDFSAVSLTQVGVPPVKCPTNPVIYQSGNSGYKSGSVVQGSDGNLYQCSIAGWCQSAAAWAYAPGSGSAWQSAWTAYACAK